MMKNILTNPFTVLLLVASLSMLSCAPRSHKAYMKHPLSTIVDNQSVEIIERETGENIQYLNDKINSLTKKIQALENEQNKSSCSCEDVNTLVDSLMNKATESNKYQPISDHSATVYFDFASDELSQESIDVINKFYEDMKMANLLSPTNNYILFASTDSKGSSEYNKALRSKRATAVSLYVSSKFSVPMNTICVSYLSPDPLLSDMENRRTIIKFLR